MLYSTAPRRALQPQMGHVTISIRKSRIRRLRSHAIDDDDPKRLSVSAESQLARPVAAYTEHACGESTCEVRTGPAFLMRAS